MSCRAFAPPWAALTCQSRPPRPREDDLIGTIPRTANRRNRAGERRVAHTTGDPPLRRIDFRPVPTRRTRRPGRPASRTGFVRLPVPGSVRNSSVASARIPPSFDVPARRGRRTRRDGHRARGQTPARCPCNGRCLGQRNGELHGFRGSGPRITEVEHGQPAQRESRERRPRSRRCPHGIERLRLLARCWKGQPAPGRHVPPTR